MNRRQFAAWLAAMSSSRTLFANTNKGTTMKVGVIGHTGRGNFGHGLDVVWNRIDSTSIAGVADANPAGLKKAIKKLQLNEDAGFGDYRKMLQTLRPDVVAVCPRHVDQHHEMMLAAIESGAKGIYVEKPFVRTPREADEVIAASEKSNTKIAVAHRNRYQPVLKVIDDLIADGKIGRLLEIRGRGKSDDRGGVEDLWVLGSHVLNLITYFGGEPVSCSGLLMQDGRRATDSDIRDGNEGLGKMAGNELHGRYLLKKGITATFDSIAKDGTEKEGFGLRLIGSKGVIDIKSDRSPLAHLLIGNPFKVDTTPLKWQPITTGGVDVPEPMEDLHKRLYTHELPALDLIDAIENDQDPLCSADDGRLTVEMICAIMQSHQQNGEEVKFPLAIRDHPLELAP